MYGAARGQEGPQLLCISLDKPTMGSASCNGTQRHTLPHQASDVCELRAGDPQPCATSWKDLLHRSGDLSAATTAQVQLVVCLSASGHSAQIAKWATRVEGGSLQTEGGHPAWNQDLELQTACRGGVAAGLVWLLAYLWAASRGQLALVQGPTSASSHKAGSTWGHGLHKGNAVCTVPWAERHHGPRELPLARCKPDTTRP